MKFDKFIDFNSRCPICDEPLTMYLQIMGSTYLKGIPILGSSNRSYRFEQIKNIDKTFKDEYINVNFNDTDTYMKFSSINLKKKLLKSQLYFSYLCNENGFKVKEHDSYYEVYLYHGCYYRSTILLDFVRDKSGECLIKPAVKGTHKLINSDEAFSLKRKVDDLEKVYMVNISYENKNTTLWYYTCTDEQAKDKDYTPKIFEKQLPLLKTRPNFDLKDRDKLFARLDNWILMS